MHSPLGRLLEEIWYAYIHREILINKYTFLAIAISQESPISTFRYYYQSINVRIRIQYKNINLDKIYPSYIQAMF